MWRYISLAKLNHDLYKYLKNIYQIFEIYYQDVEICTEEGLELSLKNSIELAFCSTKKTIHSTNTIIGISKNKNGGWR